MTPNICQYIRYCLFLFDQCTVNGLGRFEVNEVPPKSDHNGNLLKTGKYFIVLKPEAAPNSRLSVVISSREHCSEDQAEGMVAAYVQNIWKTLQSRKEFWLTQLGMLTVHNGELRLMSLTYKAEELTNYLADPFAFRRTPTPEMNGPVAHTITPDVLPAVDQPATTRTAFALHAEEPPRSMLLQSQTIPALQFQNNAANAVFSQHSIAQPLTHIYGIKRKHIRITAIALLIAVGSTVLIAFLPRYFFSDKQSSDHATIQEAGASVLSDSLEETEKAASDAYMDRVIADPHARALPNKTKKPSANSQPETAAEEKPAIASNSTEHPSSQNITQPLAALPTQKQEEQPAPALNEEKKGTTELATTPPVASAAVADLNLKKEKPAEKSKTNYVAARPANQKLSVSEYIRRNIRYPEYEQNIEGSCIAEFVISKTGAITNVYVLNSLGAAFDSEIRKVARRVPKLLPATENGEPIESRLQIKIGFVYSKDQP